MEKRLPDSNLRFAIPACFRGLGHFKWLKYFQHPEEIYSLYTLMLQEYPKNIVEIGTARGGTLYLWLQAATEDAVVISIDLPGGKFGGGYRECRVPFYQSFKKADQRLHLLRCNSRDPANPGKIKKFVGNQAIDFLFIDADHRFEGVSTNFRLYAPLVRPGGIIALHDILPSVRNPEIQVCQLWDRLKNLPGAFAYTQSRDQQYPLGIGVVRVPENGLGNIMDDLPFKLQKN